MDRIDAVLGCGLSVRPVAAADNHRGLVKKVLVANVRLDRLEGLGIVPSHTSLNRDALIKLGVPQTAIEPFWRRRQQYSSGGDGVKGMGSTQ